METIQFKFTNPNNLFTEKITEEKGSTEMTPIPVESKERLRWDGDYPEMFEYFVQKYPVSQNQQMAEAITNIPFMLGGQVCVSRVEEENNLIKTYWHVHPYFKTPLGIPHVANMRLDEQTNTKFFYIVLSPFEARFLVAGRPKNGVYTISQYLYFKIDLKRQIFTLCDRDRCSIKIKEFTNGFVTRYEKTYREN